MRISSIMFALLRFEINGMELCEDIKDLTTETLTALFKLSKRHDLAHLIGDALDKNGLLTDGSENKRRFLQERNMAVYRYEQLQYELDCICETFKRAEIPFIPLKGAVLRQYYPEPWMRTSCDIDIFVKEEDLSAAIGELKKELNYRYDGTGNHDAHLFAESGVHLELHYKLNPNNETWNKVLDKFWESLVDDNGYHRVVTQEFFYFYHIAHMAGHFKIGGCGVRPFLDVFLLRKYNQYDEEILTRLLKDGGLGDFNKAVVTVANNWFGDGERTELIKNIEEYILYAGMYGDIKNRVAVAKAKKGNKWKFLFSRLFLPYSQLKYRYPRLQKYPILYPFYVVKRWFLLLRKDKRMLAKRELEQTVRGDEDAQERVEKLLKELGL